MKQMAGEQDGLEGLRRQLGELKARAVKHGVEVGDEIHDLERRLEEAHRREMRELTRYDRVQLARHQERPFTLDFVETLCTDWVELHGDRRFRDDPAIVGGWARLAGRSVMIVGHQKGRDMKENLRRNFGSPHPEGYRKAERLFRLAEKFGRPVVTFVDTQGAYPGIGAEERGQAEAIARNLLVMAGLRAPIVSCIIGEGGSGGALGIAVADRVLMMENAIYSVISPEGCASILWKSADKKELAAEAMGITAERLDKLGLVDEIVREPLGGAHRDPQAMASDLKAVLLRHLHEVEQWPEEQLLERRYARLRAQGVYRAV